MFSDYADVFRMDKKMGIKTTDAKYRWAIVLGFDQAEVILIIDFILVGFDSSSFEDIVKALDISKILRV